MRANHLAVSSFVLHVRGLITYAFILGHSLSHNWRVYDVGGQRSLVCLCLQEVLMHAELDPIHRYSAVCGT